MRDGAPDYGACLFGGKAGNVDLGEVAESEERKENQQFWGIRGLGRGLRGASGPALAPGGV